MLSIVNGTRITPPKPDINIPSSDPNTELTVINNTEQITEENKGEVSDQKKIAGYKPDKFRKYADTLRITKALTKQQEGEKNEISGNVKKKISGIKQQNISGTRFAKEVGKGSIYDAMI